MEHHAATAGAAPTARISSPHTLPPRARFDLFAHPHKALRLCLADTLAAAGRADPGDDADVAALAGRVRAMLQFCRTHLDKEEHFVHPAMEVRRPGSSARTRDDHREHLAAFERLEAEVFALETAPADARATAAARLYGRLAVFVADNLAHMHVEETQNNAVLWDAYSDEELHALEGRLVASIPQEMLQVALRWMVPAMNPGERAAFLGGIRARAPAAAFAGTLASAQALLTESERRKLDQALAA